MSEAESLDIVVLAGGISHERDVSLRSGRRVVDALSASGHRVRMIDPDAGLFSRLAQQRPDLIWPVLHGSTGEDGALLALLESTGVPFVGARGDDAYLAWNKAVAKALVRRAGIPTPDSITLGRATFRDLGAADVMERVLAAVALPVVVKPAQGGSAQGVSIVADAGDLPRAMVEAFSYSETALIERKVDGTEVAVTVIDRGEGPNALPAVEIVPVDGVYSFDARYNAGETRFFAPARIDGDTAERVSATAVAVHELLGLRQLSRVDLIVDADGIPWFLEANALPGLTETSLVPQAVHAAGLTLAEAYDAIARTAVSRETPPHPLVE